MPNPPRKEESRRVYNCDDERLSDQLNAGFSKECEIFKVRGIQFFNLSEFYTPVCYCGDISMPQKRDTEWNELWLVVDMSVKRPHRRALAMKAAMHSRPSDVSLRETNT